MTSPHYTAVVAGQVLGRLSTQDWVSLHAMVDLKPALSTLVTCLTQDDPADVYKFYEAVPEMDGITIPSIPAPPVTSLDLWIRERLEHGDWAGLFDHFCSLEGKDVEGLADLTERLLVEISQLCGQFRLREPVDAVFQAGAAAVLLRSSSVHTQFWCQLGASLLVAEVTAAQWSSAASLVRTLTSELRVDWLAITPASITQFADIERGMVTLFVMEALVRTKQCAMMVTFLRQWDCLACLETDLGREKRDLIMLSVLECLAESNVDTETLDIMIRINEVMTATMKQERNPMVRRRHEVMSNVTFILMLNSNLAGARLYKRYQEVRSCSHELEVAVMRGLVSLLASVRNNMSREARQVYTSGVKWGAYTLQQPNRPFTLKLKSTLTLEEFSVIVTDFFAKIKRSKRAVEDSMSVFIKIEEVSVPNCGVRLLNSVRYTRF